MKPYTAHTGCGTVQQLDNGCTLQRATDKHGKELGTVATGAQLKDCEARLMKRVNTLGSSVETQLADAAQLVSSATVQQGHNKFEALRDRVLGAVDALEQQVAALTGSAGHTDQLQAQVDDLQHTFQKQLDNLQRTGDSNVASIHAVEAALTDTASQLRNEQAAEVSRMTDAVNAAKHTADSASKLAATHDSTSATLSSLQSDLQHVRAAADACTTALFGSVATPQARQRNAAVLIQLSDLSDSLRSKSDCSSVEAMKQAVTRVCA